MRRRTGARCSRRRAAHGDDARAAERRARARGAGARSPSASAAAADSTTCASARREGRASAARSTAGSSCADGELQTADLAGIRATAARRGTSDRLDAHGGTRDPTRTRHQTSSIAPPTTAPSTRFREARVVLPTFAQLADPARIPAERARPRWRGVDPDAPHPLNLFRVHWYNDATAPAAAAVPEHVVLPEALTGVKAPIVVALGDRFPMIRAHKVLAAYACLAPRLVTGQFDPDRPQGAVALDRQLLPRRRRHLAHHGLPRRRDPARGHERGAVPLARALGGRSRPTSSARRAPRATSRRSTTRAPSSPATRPTSSSTSSASSGTTWRTTSARAARWRASFETLARRRSRGCALRGVRVGHRFGRHAGRRRLPEGAPRRAHRRGRGARVPDAALQRLRRAQHPGHRRQARPADPQRDEHRRRRRRVRPRAPTSSAWCSTRTAGRAYLRHAARVDPPRCSSSSRRFGPLEHLQRARGDQDRRSTSTWARTTRSSPSPPTARRCTPPSGEKAVATSTSAAASTSSHAAGGVRASTCSGAADRPRARALAPRPHAHLQPRLLHLGRAAGPVARRLHGAARPGVLAGLAIDVLPLWDEMIAEFNREAGVRRDRMTGVRHRRVALVCAGCGAGARRRRRRRIRSAARDAGRDDDVDHVMTRSARPRQVARVPRGDDPNPFVRYRELFHSYHVARAHGMADEDVRRARASASTSGRAASTAADSASRRSRDRRRSARSLGFTAAAASG